MIKSTDCIFCKIAIKEIPADIVADNGEFLVFKDIHPKAPIHLLIIPKAHLGPVSDLKSEDRTVLNGLISEAIKIAEKMGISKNGYRLIFNVGRDAGMEVGHLHLHFLAGKSLPF